MRARAGKYKFGDRADKYKFGTRAGKLKLGTRARSQRFTASQDSECNLYL